MTKKEKCGVGLMMDVGAEKALLGSLMQSAGARDDFGWLTPEHFGLVAHQVIYARMREMHSVGRPVDMITLTSALEAAKELADVGGPQYVTECLLDTPSAANADHYAAIVADKSLRRETQAACHELLGRIGDECNDPMQLLSEVEAVMLALRDGTKYRNGDTLVSIKSAVDEAICAIEKCYSNRGKINGMPTGFVDFDRSTTGLKPGQFVVIAARPGQGKTSWAMQAAAEMARVGPIVFFSLEMSYSELANRLLASAAQVNLQRTRDGFLAKHDLPNIARAAGELSKLGIWIDAKPALSVYDFRSRARQAVRQKGAKAIFIDYLQLMRSTTRRAQENRAIEIAEISMALKAAAKDLGVPVIACAQLNRDADKRSGPPKLSDLRESGQIEQDADIIAFLHRPNKDSENPEERAEVDLNIAKHRDGPPACVKLRFHGEFARFENVTEKMYSNNPEERQK